MKKEVVYSLRMSKDTRDSLKAAAGKESRSVASLLDKIIKDHLENGGFLSTPSATKEKRWFTRKEIYKPADIYFNDAAEIKKENIVILNISLAGVLIGYPKSAGITISPEDPSKFQISMELADKADPLCFDCEANRMVDSDYAVQVGAHFVNTTDADLQTLKAYLN